MGEMVERVTRAIEQLFYADPLYSYEDPPPPEAIARVAIAVIQDVLDARIDEVIGRAVTAADDARDVWIDDLRGLLKD